MPNAPSSLDKTTTTCSAWPAVKPLPRPVPIAVPAPGFSLVSWQTLKGFIEQTTRLMLTAPSWTSSASADGKQRRTQTASRLCGWTLLSLKSSYFVDLAI
jgi:hypothetical protein